MLLDASRAPPLTERYYYYAPAAAKREAPRPAGRRDGDSDDGECAACALAAVVAVLLFFLLIFSLSYGYAHHYGDARDGGPRGGRDGWWCRQCSQPTCQAQCAYLGG